MHDQDSQFPEQVPYGEGARMRIATQDGMEVVAMIGGRACAYLLEGLDVRWTPEQLRHALSVELESAIADIPA